MAVLIDFERCKETAKPQNVTQFLQYIAKIKSTLEKKGLIISREDLSSLGKAYKTSLSDKDFGKIINYLGR